ncbi:MAG: hypothetical protein GY853_15220 [PVC group bacterium]|nr:hypothetical protein [PVC group bacterium]
MGIVLKEELHVNILSTDICSIEKEIQVSLRKLGKRLLGQVLSVLEEKEIKKNIRCTCGKNKWRNRGRVARSLRSVIGAVKYKRIRLKCKFCGKEKYPLDEKLELSSYSNMTLGLIEQSLYLATDTAYDKASDNLEKIAGIKISGRQIQNIAKEEGKRILSQVEEERKDIFEKTVVPDSQESRERVFVQVDGTFVKNRDKKKTRSMECKVGIIYSKIEQVSKNRKKILDKRTYATTHGSQRFREEFIAECNRWGVWDAKEILFLGDGASWIKRICSEDFPDAVYLLDFWHLAERIKRSLGEDHKRASENWIEDIRNNYDVKLLLSRINALYTRIRDPDIQEKLRDLYGYVKSNEEGITNWGKVNILGASGAIEKTVDVAVARRFKRRGMSWLNKGLASLLALRVLKLNGEWDNYWRLRGVPV